MLKAGKLVYQTSYSEEKIAKLSKASLREVKKINKAIDLYLNSDLDLDENLTAYEIAQKVDGDYETIRAVLRNFLMTVLMPLTFK